MGPFEHSRFDSVIERFYGVLMDVAPLIIDNMMAVVLS